MEKKGENAVEEEIPGIVTLYADGSIERRPMPFPSIPASSEEIGETGDRTVSRDVPINPSSGTWARIFLPPSSSSSLLLPLVLHFHGGAMCMGSPSDAPFHLFCSRMAAKSHSIWVSVSYRLSPEHRLPTQYHDCHEALLWLRDQFCLPPAMGDPWLLQFGDPCSVFCAGESAGATILHFVAMRFSEQDWNPLNIRGLMFVDIGLFGEKLPAMKPSTDPWLTTELVAKSMRLSLPVGAKFGDPVIYCLHPDSRFSEKPFPPVLVTVADRDLLYEGGLDYFHALKEAGKEVELFVTEGEGHCFHLRQPNSVPAEAREGKMIEFMQKLQKVE